MTFSLTTILARYLRRGLRYGGEVLALPLVLLIRLISPLVLIRFGRLSGGVGNFTMNTELYLCERDVAHTKRPVLDFFDAGGITENKQVLTMRKRQMRISRFVAPFYFVNRRIPGYQRHEIVLSDERDTNGVLSSARIHLLFTPEEEERGKRELAEMGVPEDVPFVCFLARDSAYKNATHPGRGPELSDYRNADVNTFLPAARELIRRGYAVIRVGAIVAEPLGDVGPGIIDYPTSGKRSDFLDVYLSARCRFWLGTPVGMSAVALVTKTPTLHVNYIPLGIVVSWGPQDLFIPKKLWSRTENRFMTLWEILESPVGWPYLSPNSGWLHTLDQYRHPDVDIVDNTADEITAVAIEMDERLNGISPETSEVEESVQSMLRTTLEQSRWHHKVKVRIGSSFIRNNPEIVELPNTTPRVADSALPD